MFKINYYVTRGDFMKKVLFILTAFLLLTAPSFAELTTDDAISPAYIINHGYSKECARIINLQHAQINGTKSQYDPNTPHKYENNKAVKFVKDLFIYIDPAIDNGKFGKDNIDYSTRYDDM